MKKKFFIIIILIIGLAIPVYFVFGNEKLHTSMYSGEILLINDPAYEYGGGLVSIDAKKEKISVLINELKEFNFVEYSKEKNKLLLTNKFGIYEYDLSSTKLMSVLEYPKEYRSGLRTGYGNAKYVPNSNSISYIEGGNFYIFNRDTKTDTKLTKALGDYTWYKDGKSFLFCPEDWNEKIYSYNLSNNMMTFMYDGSNPEYSNDYSKNLYLKNGQTLIIHDIATNEDRTLDVLTSVGLYCFSPDDKYIIFGKYFGNGFLQKGYQIYIWDVEKNTTQRILKKSKSYSTIGFDWK